MKNKININYLSKEFSEKIYNNDDSNIINDMNKSINSFLSNNFDEYNTIKLFKSLFAYCGKNNIDLNKYFSIYI